MYACKKFPILATGYFLSDMSECYRDHRTPLGRPAALTRLEAV